MECFHGFIPSEHVGSIPPQPPLLSCYSVVGTISFLPNSKARGANKLRREQVSRSIYGPKVKDKKKTQNGTSVAEPQARN